MSSDPRVQALTHASGHNDYDASLILNELLSAGFDITPRAAADAASPGRQDDAVRDAALATLDRWIENTQQPAQGVLRLLRKDLIAALDAATGEDGE